MADKHPQLEYGVIPSPKRGKQIRLAFGICVLVVLLLVGGVFAWVKVKTYLYFRGVYRAALADQQKCMNFTAPPDKVMYEEDPVSADKVLTSGGTDYRRVQKQSGVGFQLLVFGHRYAMPFGTEDALVFLHERSAKGGTPRLVAIDYVHADAFDEANTKKERIFFSNVWDVANGSKLPQRFHMFSNAGVPLLAKLHKGQKLRLYAGQPDDDDPSHFTIRYEVEHQSGMIDGWLQADDTVKLQVRDGPAK
jgi:hypothetical protein